MNTRLILVLLLIASCSGKNEKIIKEYGLGKAEFAKGNLEASRTHFSKVHDSDSSYEDVPLYLAKIEYYQGNFAGASVAFRELLDDDIYGYQALILKLKSDYAHRKDRSELLKEVGEALKKESGNLDLLILSAKLNEELGQTSQAILYYQRVLNEADKLIIAHKELRKIYQKVGIQERVNYHTYKVELYTSDNLNTKKTGKK
jgi:tetratricopeptide (TPR) repeat protein